MALPVSIDCVSVLLFLEPPHAGNGFFQQVSGGKFFTSKDTARKIKQAPTGICFLLRLTGMNQLPL